MLHDYLSTTISALHRRPADHSRTHGLASLFHTPYGGLRDSEAGKGRNRRVRPRVRKCAAAKGIAVVAYGSNARGSPHNESVDVNAACPDHSGRLRILLETRGKRSSGPGKTKRKCRCSPHDQARLVG